MMVTTDRFYAIVPNADRHRRKYILVRAKFKDIEQIGTQKLKRIKRDGAVAFNGFVFVECGGSFNVCKDGEFGTEWQESLYLASTWHDFKTHKNYFMPLDTGDFKAFGTQMENREQFGSGLFDIASLGSTPGYKHYEDIERIDKDGNAAAFKDGDTKTSTEKTGESEEEQ